MKNIIIAAVVSSAFTFSAVASNVQEAKVKYVGDLQFASFCKAVVNDDVALFKMTLSRFVGELGASRASVLKKVTAQDSVQCAGKDLVEFTQQRNAQMIQSYLQNTKA